jgi:chemotaxis signal transduction protein
VRVGASRYALPIHEVLRVLRSLQVFSVAGSRRHLVGLAQVGGEPLAVIDLHALAGGEGIRDRGLCQAVIVSFQDADHAERVAIAIDEALTVATLGRSEVVGDQEGVVVGEGLVDGEMVRIVDLAHLGEPG